MDNVTDFFLETEEGFTVFVVEQRFAVGRGLEYFRSYKGTVNYIDSDLVIKKRLSKILRKINQHVPNTVELINTCFKVTSPISILDAISSLSKIFSVNEHQAVGPEVIDPIIIQEGRILPKYINQIIALHKDSILRPAIIIILIDNNFDRAKQLLAKCPHGTNIKFIRNSGECEFYKVINCGAESTDDFLDAFALQCFSTCSRTKRNILCNDIWAENSLIKKYGLQILHLRTNLLFRDKTLVRNDLNALINEICNEENLNGYDIQLAKCFECILKLFRVFCNDGGIQDINDSMHIAQNLNNDILLAHVYRNAYFLEQFSMTERLELMDVAYEIFAKNKMEDSAIYCKNNKLVRQFDTDFVSVYDFMELQEEAVYNVPGLVGMAHILNNVGAALLTNGRPDESIEFFNKGLDYAVRPERCIQKIALMSNRIIADCYCYNEISDTELKKIMNLIFDNKEMLNVPFLSARYALNLVSAGFRQSTDLGEFLLQQYPVDELVQNSLNSHILGSGQLILQMSTISEKYGNNYLLETCNVPSHFLEAKGIRRNFIEKNAFNPCSFSTWF